MSNQIVPFDTMAKMSQAVTQSGLFGLKNANQALTLLMLADSEGLHPMAALKQYHIINGKPALKSAEVLSRFQSAGGTIEYITSTDEVCEAKFTHEKGGSITIKWDIEKAKKAGIYDSNPVWKKYPSNMLRSRCVTDGVTAIYPTCLGGNIPDTVAYDMEEQSNDSCIAVEAEIIEENNTEKEHTKNKRTLSTQLASLSLSKADITAFANMFELSTNKELLKELVNNKDMLVEYVIKFEGESK